jgi:hypothetical protein
MALWCLRDASSDMLATDINALTRNTLKSARMPTTPATEKYEAAADSQRE